MEKTKVVCPVCGTEIAIPEKEFIATGLVIGQNSGLGTIALTPANPGNGASAPAPSTGASPLPNKADDRLAALKKAGIDTTNLFAMQGASGNGMIARLTNGVLTVVPEDDPIFAAIVNGGTIPERRLFRRWVMSQMFHMLAYKGYRGENGFTAALHAKGYEYQWSMLLEELRVQARLATQDPENFVARNRFFNKEVCIALINDYMDKLKKHIDSLKVKRCKGVPYITIHSRDIFVADLEAKLYRPLQNARCYVNMSKNPFQLYNAMCKVNHLRETLAWQTPQCREWVSAFKGSGAYFTLTNLIRFHGCAVMNGNRRLTTQKSLDFVNLYAEQYKKEGWRLFAFLKQFIEQNGIDIEAKMKEWAKAKRNRNCR